MQYYGCPIFLFSIKWLALGEGEAFEEITNSSIKRLSIEKLSNGSLETKGNISLDLITLEKYGLCCGLMNLYT